MPSVFSRIISGELPGQIVWQDDKAVAFLDLHPINPGHLLIVPRVEVPHIWDLPVVLYHHLWDVAHRLSGVLKKVTGAPRIAVAVEGFTVQHAHIHLVPSFKVNDLNPMRAKSAMPAELEAMKAKILAAMK